MAPSFDELTLAEDRCERAALALQALTIRITAELRHKTRELAAALDALDVARGSPPPAAPRGETGHFIVPDRRVRVGDSDTTAALDLAARGWAALRPMAIATATVRFPPDSTSVDVLTAEGRRQCEIVEDRAGQPRGDRA